MPSHLDAATKNRLGIPDNYRGPLKVANWPVLREMYLGGENSQELPTNDHPDRVNDSLERDESSF